MSTNPLMGFLSPQSSGMEQLMTAMRSGGDPIAFLGSLAGIDVSHVSKQSLPDICRRLCEQRGINFDQALQQAQSLYSQLGGKR